MKRIVSLLLALSMVLSLCVSAFAANYSDLTGNNLKYASAVDALTELGVIDGFPDKTFRPEEDLTRAQVAKMLVICLGLGDSVESLATKTVFSDVAASHWASGYINAAAQSKIIVGYPDGTFKPDNKVTYAEAFTMALRALGYGNVVEAEGTWPTAYLLKAVELELNDDMDPYTADKAASRGNTAVLLWNMLRRPMWKIYQESQGNGMTLEARDDFMLNVKFPKYAYVENVYLDEYEVSNDADAGLKVRAKVSDLLPVADENHFTMTAYVRPDTDISRFVVGMKVASLIKDYKDEEKATFLTLTPEYSFVEGLVTSVEKLDDGRVEIENTEYKLEEDIELAENVFVVAEVDGKKILNIKTLPNEGKEVAKPSTLKSKIDEDALVIIDGKWATRDDIEEGDVYTELNKDNDQVDGDAYYMVARERVAGTFESLTYEKDDDERMYFEVDGAEYRTFESRIKGNVFEGEDEEKVEDEIIKLTKKKKDNDYLDKEIELVMNYLGQVVKAYFGDVKGNGKGNNFYAVMSNGVWDATDPETGDSALKIRLANAEDEDGKPYQFTADKVDSDFDGTKLEHGEVYKNAKGESGEGVFVWAKLDGNGKVKTILPLEAGLEDNEAYDDDYAFVEFAEGYDKGTGYIETEDGKFKVTSATTVFKLTPELDEDDENVVGFKFEVAADPKAALQGVEEGLVAYDVNDKINKNGQIMTASFVFIMEDAISADLNVGVVDKVKESRGISYVYVDGEWREVDTDSKKSIVEDYADVKELDKCFIVFQVTDSEKAVVRGVLESTQLGDASVVTTRRDSVVQLDKGLVEGEEDFDLENKDDVTVKAFDNYQIVLVNASVNKDSEVEFDDGENLGTGLPAGKYERGYRLIVDEELEVLFIVAVEGVDEEDTIDENGVVHYADEEEDDNEDSGENLPDDSGETLPDDSGEQLPPEGDDSGDQGDDSGDQGDDSGDQGGAAAPVAGDDDESGDSGEGSGD